MTWEIFNNIICDIIIKRNIEQEFETAKLNDVNNAFNLRFKYPFNTGLFLIYKRMLYKRYLKRRNLLKKDLGMDLYNDHLDCHKVAAVLLFTILDFKPIRFSVKRVQRITDIPEKILMVNYKVAFSSACAIVYNDMLKKLFDDNNLQEREVLLHNGALFMPNVHEKFSPYSEGYAKLLYLYDHKGIKNAYYLEVADSMYFIEMLNYKYLFPDYQIISDKFSA